jgi:hypothetical protein
VWCLRKGLLDGEESRTDMMDATWDVHWGGTKEVGDVLLDFQWNNLA